MPPREHSSLAFLPPSQLPKTVPVAGRFNPPLTPFSIRFLPYPSRAAQAPQKPCLQRHPPHSRLVYPGVLHIRRPPPRPPVLCMSPPCLGLQPLHRRRRTDDQRQQRVRHPAVDYGFGPGGASGPSSRRGKSPPRVPRPRRAPPAVATPTLADSPVRPVPLPSDRDHAEPIWEVLSYG